VDVSRGQAAQTANQRQIQKHMLCDWRFEVEKPKVGEHISGGALRVQLTFPIAAENMPGASCLIYHMQFIES